MSVYDEVVEPSSDSFWEIGQYKRTVKRVDDGFELCTKLMQLMQERADIEKGYSTNLKKWSAKWKAFLDKGPEYGTMKSAWMGFTEEADSMSEIHNTIRGRLVDNVQTELKTWQKDNYHKSALRLKTSKDLEEKFQKAQKPWAKQYKTAQECKKNYQSACKLEAGLQQSKSDSSAQPEAVKKLTERLNKAEKDTEKSRGAYKAALDKLSDLRSSYTSEMSSVFNEAQDFERTRLEFFKQVLRHLHDSLNISNEERIPQTYENLLHTVDRADSTQDLRWWSQNHGSDMAAQWPQFEEFGAPPAAGGGGSGSGGDGTGVGSIRGKKSGGSSLTAADEQPGSRGPRNNTVATAGGGQQSQDTESPSADNFRRLQQQQPSSHQHQSRSPHLVRTVSAYSDSLNPFAEPAAASAGPGNNSNPFDDEMPARDHAASGIEDDGRQGAPVRALYDYAGTEEDELSFQAGDVFEKLDDEDEQGWCKGRKDGRVGLYPANYVELA